jgi:hypothetical protein
VKVAFAVFGKLVSFVEAYGLTVTRATFAGGIHLEPRETIAPAEWRFENCEFHPTAGPAGASIDIRNTVPSRLLRLKIRRSNVLGPLRGAVRVSAELDAVRNYWQPAVTRALEGMASEGRVSFEPVLANRVVNAGACDEGTLGVLLGTLDRKLVPSTRERILSNSSIGFEVEFPEGWRPAGTKMLVPPARYARARVRFAWHAHETLPVRLRARIISDLSNSPGVSQVEANRGDILTIGESEALDILCTFTAGGSQWAHRVILIRAAKGTYAITLIARKRDLASLNPDFMKILKSFRKTRP